VKLSVVLITCNEETNLARTLESVRPLVREGQGEIIVVDSGSTDRTVEIAKSYGARVFVEAWKGYAAQKNSAIEKATGDWILSLDADEELDGQLQSAITTALENLERVDTLRRQADAHPFMMQDARAELADCIDVKGDQVTDLWLAGDLTKIVEYNQIDVLNTYLLWLRAVYFCGKMSEEDYFSEQEQFRAFLENESQKPERAFITQFLEKWPE